MGFELNSVHVTAHTTPQDQVVYALSGGVVIDFPLPTTAEITGSLRIGPNGVLMPDWRRKQLEFIVPIPDLPDDSLLRIHRRTGGCQAMPPPSTTSAEPVT
jgi:hypothetical protein